MLIERIAKGFLERAPLQRRQLVADLANLAGIWPDAKAAAAAYVAPPPVGDHLSFVRDERIELLFDRPQVRQAVAAELSRLSFGKLRGFVGQVADELRAERAPSEKWIADPVAADKLRVCNDPEAMSFGLHWHADPADPDGGALMLKPERLRCWLRICPKCSKDHAARLRKRYEGRIQTVIASRVPSCALKHLVLTMPRSADLRGDLRRLHRCTKKLVKHFWGRPGQGAFATAEIGPKGGNVHVHAIVYGRYVKQAAISDYWRQLTGDSFVVWIKPIKPSAAVREGLKYVTKLGNRDEGGEFVIKPADLAELHMALKGRRRVWAWGAFYGLADADADAAPDETETDEPAAEQCKCGAAMVFISVPEARALLRFKGANNCPPPSGLGLGYGAGSGARAGPAC